MEASNWGQSQQSFGCGCSPNPITLEKKKYFVILCENLKSTEFHFLLRKIGCQDVGSVAIP